MNENRAYRTLFIGELVQESALSVGGKEQEGSIDDPFCRDGLGRHTLRGDGLAGALIAVARTLYGPDIPKTISAPGPEKNASHPPESLWRVFHSHPKSDQPALQVENRSGVGLLQETGAPAAGVLFDAESLPAGTRWPLIIEVNTSKKGGCEAEAIAAVTLLECRRGLFWLGRSPARGMGWMRLEDLKCYRLTTKNHTIWPDSSKDPQETLQTIAIHVPAIAPEEFTERFTYNIPAKHKRTHYIELEGVIECGEREDGYGIDAVAVSGHDSNLELAKWDENRYCSPEGMEMNQKDFIPDASPVLTYKDGDFHPFLPGSGIRGTIRHTISRHLRKTDNHIQDPNAPGAQSAKMDDVQRVFGNLDCSAKLLVKDAYLDNQDYTFAWLQHHAEDEFTQGAYESSKFDNVVLLKGNFNWKMVVQIHAYDKSGLKSENAILEEVERARSQLEIVLKLGSIRHLPVGGRQWSGVGWPKWKVTRAVRYVAGEEADAGEELAINTVFQGRGDHV